MYPYDDEDDVLDEADDPSDGLATARVYSTGASEVYAAGVDHKTVLKWCVPPDFQRRCLGAPTVTVVVQVRLADEVNDEDATVDLSDVFCTIDWGSGEDSGPDDQQADVDVVGGSAFTCQAWSVGVSVTYRPATVDPVAHPPIRVDVTIGIGASGKAGVSPSATRTVKLGTIEGGGASAIVAIPLYAVGVRIVNRDATVATLDVRQYLNPLIATFVSVARVGKLETDPVPIARGLGARWIDVQNNAGQGLSHDTALIFDLCPN